MISMNFPRFVVFEFVHSGFVGNATQNYPFVQIVLFCPLAIFFFYQPRFVELHLRNGGGSPQFFGNKVVASKRIGFLFLFCVLHQIDESFFGF